MMKSVSAALEPPTEVTEGTSSVIEEVEELRAIIPSNTTSPLLTASSKDFQSTPGLALSTLSPSTSLLAAMANFTVDLDPFTPPTMVIEDGGPLRRARREVYIRGGVAKSHEDCAIAVINGDFPVATQHQILHDITNYIITQHQLNVRFFALHPHSIGIFRLRNTCLHDALIALNPHFIGHRERSPFTLMMKLHLTSEECHSLESVGLCCWDTHWISKM
jgi:hypothetical protein